MKESVSYGHTEGRSELSPDHSEKGGMLHHANTMTFTIAVTYASRQRDHYC